MTTAPGPLSDTATDTEASIRVGDDGASARLMTGAIIEEQLGWRVTYAEDGAAGLAAMERAPPSVVLTDLCMPGMDGLELVAAVHRQHPSVPVVIMTAF